VGDEAGAMGDREWRRRELERISLAVPALLERANEPPETGPRFYTLGEQGSLIVALRTALTDRHEAKLATALIELDRAELAHSARRMLQALDAYWLHCDGLPSGREPRSESGAEDWWYRFEKYRKEVEAHVGRLPALRPDP
jgi:hypothetical protein